MDKEIIKKIIEAANQAPSGGNSQPWRFKVSGDVIEVLALPEKDHPILNFRNRGTYVAHGALMENIDIAARHFGLEPKFELFPSEGIYVRVTFIPLVGAVSEDLFEMIPHRHSNRKPYIEHSLTSEVEYLLSGSSRYPECEVHVLEGEELKAAAQHLPLDLSVFLQNELLHKHLFKEILWNEEDQKQRGGLFVKTMETTGPKALAMRLLGNRKIAKLATKLKIHKKIEQENARTAGSASLIIAISVRNDDSAFLHAGRLMENIWLRATKQGLSFQLVSGLSFLWQQLNYGDHKIFSENEKNIINEGYRNLVEIFGVRDRIIGLTFRIGKSDKPLAVSYKRPPEVDWE